jgi:hypothetical protein
MSIESLRRAAFCPFLIVLVAVASWPGVAATEEDAAGAAPPNAYVAEAS